MRLAWLLPIIVGAVAVWAVVAWPKAETADTAEESQSRVTTFVAADATDNGHEGIIQGPVSMGLPGHDGEAFSFAEPGSWIMVPSSAQLNAGTSDFLVSAWIKVEANPPDAGETYDVVRKGIAYTVPGEYRLELLGNGRVRCSAQDAQSRLATATSDVRLPGNGTWHLIGCARTGGQWSVLVDDEVKSEEVDLGAVSNDVALAIGSKYGLEDRPLGMLDDVKLIIDREGSTATDAEAAIRELEATPPVAWWKMDETATSATGR